jgi:hypothetical protein
MCPESTRYALPKVQTILILSHIVSYTPQSQLLSFHPVRHLSSHFAQSNSFFPSFLLTSLCASHIHCPNSSLLSALTLFFSIKTWKSSAQTQHGYSFPNSPRNCLTLLCSLGLGFSGYIAVIECKSVQLDRPSSSTSGGQSFAGAVVLIFLVEDVKSESDVQVRHLRTVRSPRIQGFRAAHGFPSFPSTTPFRSFGIGVSVDVETAVPLERLSRVSSPISITFPEHLR